MKSLIRHLSCSALASTLLFACGEEPQDPPPPNPPSILSGGISCRMLRGTYVLERVYFTVEDLDGVETLNPPEAIVLSYQLEVTGTPIPTLMGGEGEEAGEGEESSCASDACQINYEWVRDGEEINCGETGEALSLSIRVEDEEGFYARAESTSRPE
ncbi:MAG: hypothetical protein VYD19_04655 [Myxococcota bacterium]|nr:hypothetical protein [Myxococcota bacterium]